MVLMYIFEVHVHVLYHIDHVSTCPKPVMQCIIYVLWPIVVMSVYNMWIYVYSREQIVCWWIIYSSILNIINNLKITAVPFCFILTTFIENFHSQRWLASTGKTGKSDIQLLINVKREISNTYTWIHILFARIKHCHSWKLEFWLLGMNPSQNSCPTILSHNDKYRITKVFASFSSCMKGTIYIHLADVNVFLFFFLAPEKQ